MSRLTLRDVPDDVLEKVRETAKASGQSLNKAAISLLRQAVGLFEGPKKRRDVSQFLGCWSREEAEEMRKNLEIFETIDPETWK